MMNIDKIKKRSKQGAILSLFGFILIIVAFVYASMRLKEVSSEIEHENEILQAVSANVNIVEDSLLILNSEIESLQNIISNLSIGKSYIDLGIDEYYTGNYLKAISFYDTAIMKYQQNAAAYALKGQAEIVLQRYKSAEKNLIKSIAIDSLRPQSYYSLILLYSKVNDVDQAFYYLNKMLDIAPQFINYVKFTNEMSLIVSNPDFDAIDRENKNRLKFVQTELKKLGYYKGVVDQIPGRETSLAISKFQKENELKHTGTWDITTLKQLNYK